MLDMTGKTAVVTGAGSGFGRATALAFARHGAEAVACIDIADETNEATAALVREAGREAFAIHADLRVVSEIRAAFAEVMTRRGRLDAVANMCGVTQMGPTLDITEEEWDQSMNSNVKNGFFCCQEAMKVMYEQGFGAICNMSGEAAFYPMEYCLLQATAKGAIYHMTQTLALEAAAHDVRVNCVSAGIGAGAPGQFGLGWKNPAERARPDGYEFDARNVVTKRQRGPEEVADTFVYLCSDLAVGISGQIVFVNGGGFYSLLVKPRSAEAEEPASS